MDNTPSSSNKLVPVLVVLLIVASFFIGSLYTRVKTLESTSTGTNNNVAGAVANNQPAAPAAPTGPVDIDISGYPVLGNKDAKIAIVEFTDYQCPFCAQLVNNTFPDVKKNYIDTGKIKYIVRDFPLTQIHPQAQKAAEAVNCAEEQGKFWEYHDVLFKNQTALTIDDLKKYAVNLGLNTGTFNSCLDTGKMAEIVKKDQAEGEKYGVNGTPSSFVGVIEGNTVKGVQVSGAVPFESFKATIEEQLNKV